MYDHNLNCALTVSAEEPPELLTAHRNPSRPTPQPTTPLISRKTNDKEASEGLTEATSALPQGGHFHTPPHAPAIPL